MRTHLHRTPEPDMLYLNLMTVSKSSCRLIGIGGNTLIIKKQVASNEKYQVYNNPDFILRAAIYCYNKFGFHASIDYYIDYLDQIKNKRLYHTDLKLWKELTEAVFKRDNYTCVYCGSKDDILEVDHITPISKGGTNDLENLACSCRRCNRQKKDKSVEEFFAWRASLS